MEVITQFVESIKFVCGLIAEMSAGEIALLVFAFIVFLGVIFGIQDGDVGATYIATRHRRHYDD